MGGDFGGEGDGIPFNRMLRGPEPLTRERCMCERSGGSEIEPLSPERGQIGAYIPRVKLI